MTHIQLKRIMADQEAGIVLPEALRIPELFPDAIPFYDAFNQLSGSRQSGFSIGMIPYSEISNYLDEELIESQEERRRWRKFISLIDNVWVSNQQKQASKQKTQARSRQQQRPRK